MIGHGAPGTCKQLKQPSKSKPASPPCQPGRWRRPSAFRGRPPRRRPHTCGCPNTRLGMRATWGRSPCHGPRKCRTIRKQDLCLKASPPGCGATLLVPLWCTGGFFHSKKKKPGVSGGQQNLHSSARWHLRGKRRRLECNQRRLKGN